MYGLVNRAIEQMVCENHGEDTWEQIKAAAGVDTEIFITNEAYDDAITYRLVVAASEILRVQASQILETFGRHWILKTAVEGYGDLLRAAGADVASFLRNLPNFHARVQLLYPHLRPPRFASEELGEHKLLLRYYSERTGLAAFVRGLLLGIGELFKVTLTVEQVGVRGEELDHDAFAVTWSAPA